MPDTRRQISLRLPPDLIEQVDHRRKLTGLSRDVWAEKALRHVLTTTTAPQSDEQHTPGR